MRDCGGDRKAGGGARRRGAELQMAELRWDSGGEVTERE